MNTLIAIWEEDITHKKKKLNALKDIDTQETKEKAIELRARISELERCIADLLSFT